MRKSIVAGAMAASLLAGGAVGVVLFGPGGAVAQNAPTTPAAAPNASGTTPQSNEDNTHETAETPQREADENAGRASARAGAGTHAPNEDPTHEASENPGREAQEHPTTTTTAGTQ